MLSWYRRHFEARGFDGGKSGAVTVVQRVSSDLRLNPHFHTLALDGVYNENEQGTLTFHPLPCLTNGDVADILQIASTRVLAAASHWRPRVVPPPRPPGESDDAAGSRSDVLA